MGVEDFKANAVSLNVSRTAVCKKERLFSIYCGLCLWCLSRPLDRMGADVDSGNTIDETNSPMFFGKLVSMFKLVFLF